MEFDTEVLVVIGAIGAVGYFLYRRVNRVLDQVQPAIDAANKVAADVGSAQQIWDDIRRAL